VTTVAPPQVVQAPELKKNPVLHPIANPASALEHPSALVTSLQAVQTPFIFIIKGNIKSSINSKNYSTQEISSCTSGSDW
jgi:hypothetical protein